MVLHVSEFIFLLFQTSRMNYLQSIFRSSSIHIGAVFCRMCPVFQVSNVTGENLDLLKMFLNLLSTRVKCDISKPAEFQIDDTFSVPVSLKHHADSGQNEILLLSEHFFASLNVDTNKETKNHAICDSTYYGNRF